MPPMGERRSDFRRGDAEIGVEIGAAEQADHRGAMTASEGTTSRNSQPEAANASHAASTRATIATSAHDAEVRPLTGRRQCRPQPSLDPFGEVEENDRDQDHEQDSAVGPGKVVPLGELVDELTEATEVDQELDADDVDHRENEAEAQAHEDRRQRRRQQNLPELLRRRERGSCGRRRSAPIAFRRALRRSSGSPAPGPRRSRSSRSSSRCGRRSRGTAGT